MDPLPDIATLVRGAMRQPQGLRLGWLRQHCAGDAAVLAAAEHMLAAQESATIQPDGPGDDEAVRVKSPAVAPRAMGLPERLGHYRILGLLGEGGMGVVYLAEQERPRRTVALKVVRPGLMTPKMLRRFETETQTLARLQHPGIAQVYEAGTLDSPGCGQQPFFAMEYIAGEPLNDYAAERALPTNERLRLFIRVCDAVQHAHQRGVIHRDLKSSNILITSKRSGSGGDGAGVEGEPKILDFGVAKLTDADGGIGATMRTDVGQVVGTIPYMSPEQIAGRADDIDTRSDVYTLGVVLFELLSGELPHPVSGRTIVEASRIITDQDAPKLGTIRRELRGDLECIVAKAVEKDRDRRYQSPAELAADLERTLRDEPILARPASTVYQLRKFARRNKPVVIAAGAACGLLVLGVLGVTWQAIEATRGRQLAELARADADEAKQAAIKEAHTAREINTLLTEMLQSADPDVSLGREVTVQEVLDRTAAGIESAVHDPRVLASVRSTLAGTYQNLNKLAAAEEQARAALAILDAELGRDAAETLEAMRGLANILADQGRFADAEPLAREALDRAVALHGAGSAETLAPLIVLSRVLHEAGKMPESTGYLDEALRVAGEQLGPRHPDTLLAMHNKASALKDDARFDEAIEMFRRVISARTEVFGPSHSQTLSSMNNLAATLQKAGRNEEALDLFRQIYEQRRRVLGEDHAGTLTTLSNMSVCLIVLKRLDEAEPILRRALDGYLRVAGEDHNKTLITMANLAFLEEDRGRIDEAERLYRRVIEIRTRGENPNEPELLSVMNNLAMLLQTRGDLGAAVEVFADLTARANRALPPGHHIAAIFANNYGDCLTQLGRYAEAEPLLRESLAMLEKSLGAEHARTIKARARLERWQQASGAGAAREPANDAR